MEKLELPLQEDNSLREDTWVQKLLWNLYIIFAYTFFFYSVLKGE